MNTQQSTSDNIEATIEYGRHLGSNLVGGEVIELISDLGGGKTSLVRGIAAGFGSKDPVTSPSFTICNTYSREDGTQINHFDFYRLSEAGIMQNELSEYLHNPSSVVIIEWGDIVHNILPSDRIVITITTEQNDARQISSTFPDSLEYVFAQTSKETR